MARKREYYEGGRRYPGCWFYTSANGRDKTYHVKYYKDKKPIIATFGRYSEGKTLASCHHWRSDLIRGKMLPPQQQRKKEKEAFKKHIQPLFEFYMVGRENKQDVSRYINYVYPFWVGREITSATNVDAAKYRKWLEERETQAGSKLSPQSIKHCIGLFRRIVLFAKRHSEDFKLLIDDFHIPRVLNEETEDLTSDQLKRLLHVLKNDKINRPACDMLMVILNTGMRHGEVLKLQWQHVNFDRKTLLLKNPKGNVDVSINMNSVVEEILKRQVKTSMYVFPGENGNKRNNITKAARRIMRLAGISDSFRQCHGLRHFYGTELAANGVDVKTISSLMGHKSLDVTNRYLKARDERKIEAVNHMAVITGGE